jgi:hypothetical protein
LIGYGVPHPQVSVTSKHDQWLFIGRKMAKFRHGSGRQHIGQGLKPVQVAHGMLQSKITLQKCANLCGFRVKILTFLPHKGHRQPTDFQGMSPWNCRTA